MDHLEKRYTDNLSPREFSALYFKYIGDLASQMDFEAVGKMIESFKNVRESGRFVYFIGNGGSAATATHFANDIGIGAKIKDKKPFKALGLADNMAVLTAVANDFGYSDIFTNQLENLISKGDLLVAMSVSGNSENVINAVEFAKSKGAYTIGLTGFDGGRLRTAADLSVHVPAPKPEYGPVEDLFMVVDHLITAYFRLSEMGHL